MENLLTLLTNANVDYEIIHHARPILSTADAQELFDIRKCTPIFILKTENEFIALIISGQTGKVNFKALRQLLGLKKLCMASREEVLETTGYEVGSVPLVGHNLPTVIDKRVLESDYIYGGTGNLYHTLKIRPGDLLKINNILAITDLQV